MNAILLNLTWTTLEAVATVIREVFSVVVLAAFMGAGLLWLLLATGQL